MSQWNDLSRDRLIKEYQKYPCLWSNKDEDIKNAEKRKECLTLITAELNNYEEKPFTQEEVRTQFKNLRDMYRRKRKKLQLQQEMNITVDEPGWVYFQRLKFLDEAIDFGPPTESSSSVLPPSKKKSKSTTARPSDDASLPTPIEENSIANLVKDASPFLPVHQQQQDLAIAEEAQDEAMVIKQGQGTERKAQKTESPTEEVIKQETEIDEWKQSGELDDELEGGDRSPDWQTEHAEKAEIAGGTLQYFETGSLDVNSQASLNGNVRINEQSCQTSAREIQDHSASSKLLVSRKRFQEDEEGEEFTYFGRFVAIALKKIAAMSPIDALEARKEIGDVLYRAELQSLSK